MNEWKYDLIPHPSYKQKVHDWRIRIREVTLRDYWVEVAAQQQAFI